VTGRDTDHIVDALCDLSAEEREAWFAEHDLAPDLRARAEKVLAHFDALIDEPEAMPAAQWARDAADAVVAEQRSDVPTTLGPYRVLDVIGSGGMGIVYRAEQAEPRRQVAIKVLRARLVADVDQRRFEREAELLGRLQHPGIAQVFELGRTDDGATYLVMEYIEGQRLTRWADEQDLDRDDRLRLLADLGEAVHHAHLRGVVHRDLKPDNVLVTTEGRVKVIDFGVARALDRKNHATLETTAGQIVGTLAYMSPEQVRGEVGDIDARADVYALGVLAYQLLARRLPHELDRTTLAEAARLVVEVDPPLLGKVASDCRGDVEHIVCKALEKEPDRRYSSAAALAADIRRFLSDEPIVARPASTVYQLRKLARRNRVLVGGAATTLLAILVGAGIAFDQALVNRRLAAQEAEARAEAEESADRAHAETARTAEARADAERNAKRARDEAVRAEALAVEAQRSALKAEQARQAEAQRADELDQVARYQEALIQNIDASMMGAGFRDDVLADVRAALELQELDGAAHDELVSRYEDLLDQVDLVGVATAAIGRSLFTPAKRGIEDRFADQPLVQARLFLGLAAAQMRTGLKEDALESQRLATELQREHLGDDHELTLVSRATLAGHLTSVGADAEALHHYQELRPLLLEHLGMEHPTTVEGLLGLATNLGRAGDLETSLEVYGETVQASEAIHGPRSQMTLIIKGSLARTMLSVGRYEDAEGILREVLDAQRDQVAADYPPALKTLGDLGGTLAALERFDEGEPMLREACERLRRRLGDGHPRTVLMVERLGHCLSNAGRFDEAETLLREMVAIRRVPGSVMSGGLAESLMDLSMVLLDLDRAADAERLILEAQAEALARASQTGGDEHPDVVRAAELLRLAREVQQASRTDPPGSDK